MKYQIPSSIGDVRKWGILDSHCGLPAHTHSVLGASLDFACSALLMVENQLLFEIGTTISDHVAALLYIYFAVPRDRCKEAEGKDTAAKIVNLLRETRLGLEGDKGSITIEQNAANMDGNLNGYVMYSRFTGVRDNICYNFPKIMGPDLQAGAVFFVGLIIHEATHKYPRTDDSEVRIPGVGKELGYFKTSRVPILQSYHAAPNKATARTQIAGRIADHITTPLALKNADSFSWFVTAMIQDYANTLGAALKLPAPTKDLRDAAAAFARAQREALPDEMYAIPGFITTFVVA